MRSSKITAPIARSTAYDFNCFLPKTHTGSGVKPHSNESQFKYTHASEEQDIMEHEILFQMATPNQNGRLRAASSLNGISFKPTPELKRVLSGSTAGTNCYSEGNGIDWKSVRDAARNTPAFSEEVTEELTKMINYIGVAVTGCKAGMQGALQRQGYSATRGGLNTILNTGSEPIYAGQKIAVELNAKDVMGMERRIDGVPKEKVMLRTVPYKYSADNSSLRVNEHAKTDPEEPVDPDQATEYLNEEWTFENEIVAAPTVAEPTE
jgi:hypothetical protein